ncbi:MAG TPA: GGDEF domain-containing protein [Solirubrobacteraceae bacterium]|jgi:diguanylate cyclase (GGDEF)-like protein|nr:GGDEF domain-containing protein [Solirubrobacteraceae bacterium]
MRTESSQLLWQPPGPAGSRLAAEVSPRAGAGPALLRALARRVTADRPAMAWSLALLFEFKALIALATVAFPISASEPTRLIGVAGVVTLVGGCVIWLFANRIALLGFELLAGAGAVATSALISRAGTHGGMMLGAFAYPWIAIYAAHFFPRRAVNALGLLISVGFGAGLLLGNLSHVIVYWLVVTVTIWSICILLGNLSESLRRQIGTDQLTGLLNRSGFLEAAQRERAVANRTGAPLTLAVIDLDNFKEINDSAGHAAGDKLLAGLGRQWRERMRPSDVLARHGGDEFVLLLPGTEPAGANAVLKRLCSADDPVAWSIGISEWLRDEGLSAPLARADKHLYEAKLASSQGRRPVPVG